MSVSSKDTITREQFNENKKNDDLWFVIGGEEPRRYEIPQGKKVSVGRNNDQDIVLENEMVSREHLIIKKNSSGEIELQVKGSNGLYIVQKEIKPENPGDYATHFVTPGTTLIIGTHICYFEGSITKEKQGDTVHMSFDRLKKMKQDFEDNQKNTSKAKEYDETEQDDESDIEDEPNNYQNDEYDNELKDEKSQKSIFSENTDTKESTEKEIISPPNKYKQKKPGINNIIFFVSGIIITLLVVGIGLFVWQYIKENDKISYSPHKKTLFIPPNPVNKPQKSLSNSDKEIIDNAIQLMNNKKWNEAIELLLDVPEKSSYYSRAEELILEINRNRKRSEY